MGQATNVMVKQKTFDDPDMQEEVEGGLTICPSCNKKVPDTKFCLNCRNQLHPLDWMPGVVK